MCGVFISYSTNNQKLVEQVIELLQMGTGMGRQNIFCTAFNEALPTGEDFVSVIKQNMKACEMVIALITLEYLQSKFCMMELGAAWMEASYLCPILGSGVDYKDLDNTPLKSLQMRKMDDDDDWFAIYNEIVNRKIVEHFDCTQFNRKLREFLQWKTCSI